METIENPLRLMSDIQLLEVASSLDNLTPEEFLMLQEEYLSRRQYKALELTRTYFLEKGVAYFGMADSAIESKITKRIDAGEDEEQVYLEFYYRGFIKEMPTLDEEVPESTSKGMNKWLKRIVVFCLYVHGYIIYSYMNNKTMTVPKFNLTYRNSGGFIFLCKKAILF